MGTKYFSLVHGYVVDIGLLPPVDVTFQIDSKIEVDRISQCFFNGPFYLITVDEGRVLERKRRSRNNSKILKTHPRFCQTCCCLMKASNSAL